MSTITHSNSFRKSKIPFFNKSYSRFGNGSDCCRIVFKSKIEKVYVRKNVRDS